MMHVPIAKHNNYDVESHFQLDGNGSFNGFHKHPIALASKVSDESLIDLYTPINKNNRFSIHQWIEVALPSHFEWIQQRYTPEGATLIALCCLLFCLNAFALLTVIVLWSFSQLDIHQPYTASEQNYEHTIENWLVRDW